MGKWTLCIHPPYRPNKVSWYRLGGKAPKKRPQRKGWPLSETCGHPRGVNQIFPALAEYVICRRHCTFVLATLLLPMVVADERMTPFDSNHSRCQARTMGRDFIPMMTLKFLRKLDAGKRTFRSFSVLQAAARQVFALFATTEFSRQVFAFFQNSQHGCVMFFVFLRFPVVSEKSVKSRTAA